MNLRIVYPPTGAALEYEELAASGYRGCGHGCLYCFGPDCLRMIEAEFHGSPRPRKDVVRSFSRDCEKLREAGDYRRLLLSFTTDPYQPIEADHGITAEMLELCLVHDRPVTILTKGGLRAVRDFAVLKRAGGWFGTSIVWDSEHLRQEYEPNAAPIADRYAAMNRAIGEGIFTWVSIEPVIEPKQALLAIEGTAGIGVQHWKVGKINHQPELEKYILGVHDRPQDWPAFCRDLWALMQEIGPEKFYVKKSLQGYMPEGWRHGG